MIIKILLQLAKLIRQTDEDVPIVFVTNYAEYVYQGYTVNALRYLKKPVLESDISPCLDIDSFAGPGLYPAPLSRLHK